MPLPLNGEYSGKARVVGYTVAYNREDPTHAIAICDTPEGERTVVRSEDKELLDRLTKEEFCGRDIQVESDGVFSA